MKSYAHNINNDSRQRFIMNFDAQSTVLLTNSMNIESQQFYSKVFGLILYVFPFWKKLKIFNADIFTFFLFYNIMFFICICLLD